MKGTKDLIFGIRAGFPYFYVKTWEVNETTRDIVQAVDNYNNGTNYSTMVWDFADEPDPSKVLELLLTTPQNSVIIAKNLNWFLMDSVDGFNKDFTSTLQSKAEDFSGIDEKKVLIIVSNQDFDKAIPEPIQKEVIQIEMMLPNEEERMEILEYIIQSVKDNDTKGIFKEPNEEVKKKIIQNSAGLTKSALEKTLVFSVIKDGGNINPDTVFDLKRKEIEKIQGVKVGKYTQTLDGILGNENAKEIIMAMVDHPDSKGFILVGPPGTGKTHLIKAIASAFGAVVFEAELANMMGQGLVGQAEQAVKEFCDLIVANPGCFVIFDEVEKGLPKKNSGGSDVAERSMSQILKLLSDRPVPFKAFATSNNITSLPPEWLRAGRWDTAPICIDLPDEEEKKAILKHYMEEMNVTGKLSNTDGWSGAELKEVCELSRKTGRKLNEVEKWIVPISKTMKEDIDAFRIWADGRTIPATLKKAKEVKAKTSKKIEL